MKIPKRVKLFGSTINIIFDDKTCESNSGYGSAIFKEDIIYLRKNAHGNGIKETEIECTYLHEIIHFILNKNGYNKLCDDEDFVSRLARSLHQVLTTQEY